VSRPSRETCEPPNAWQTRADTCHTFMTRSLRPSSLGPSLLFATGAIGITAAAVFAAGMVVLPEEGGSQALLVLSGDDDGRYELNQLSVGEWNEGSSPEGPSSCHSPSAANNVTLLITASEMGADTPTTGEAASTTVSVAGADYEPWGMRSSERALSQRAAGHLVVGVDFHDRHSSDGHADSSPSLPRAIAQLGTYVRDEVAHRTTPAMPCNFTNPGC
jgi:hypothetical protein